MSEETKSCSDPKHEGDNPLPLTYFYDAGSRRDKKQAYCKGCSVRRVGECRKRLALEDMESGYLRRHLKKRAREAALASTFERVEREAGPIEQQDAFCFVSRKTEVISLLRQPQEKKFSWRAV